MLIAALWAIASGYELLHKAHILPRIRVKSRSLTFYETAVVAISSASILAPLLAPVHFYQDVKQTEALLLWGIDYTKHDLIFDQDEAWCLAALL